jgi:4-amino-4-deoxy-L-arabinose transferase-like glycosyltransferase
MIKFLKEMDWLSVALYGLFGFLLAVGGIGVLTQPLIFLALLAILIITDLRSHNAGMKIGSDIVKQVWDLK